MKKLILLFVIVFAIVALMACGNENKNEEVVMNQDEMQEEQLPEIDNEPTVETRSNEEIIRDLFKDYLEELSEEESGELAEYNIEYIDILPEDAKADVIKNLPDDYKETDVLAIVSFAVRPEDTTSMFWLAGNGEQSGEWVINKSLVVTLRDGELINIGTGW